jgi:D-serine deaminase-like pyridoxal phosphate-dependent protein
MTMKSPTAQIGCTKHDLDTPALCLDLDVMESNVRTMVETCRAHDVDWRPHAKCHKSPDIAQRLVQAGAIGVTCATIREAEHMAAAGITDLLIANMIAGRRKLERLVALTSCADPIVCVDHSAQASALSDAMEAAQQSVRVLIEVEIGLNRVGYPAAEVVSLARDISRLPGIKLVGVMAYEGHLLTVADQFEKETAIRSALDTAITGKDQIEQAGIPCPIFSCGGTGSYPITVKLPGVTEIQSGGAIFMDAFYREACQITELNHALTVIATVVSRPTEHRAVIDAGRKALNIEIHRPLVAAKEGVTVDWLSAEHGVLKIESGGDDLQIGEQVELIPGYADLTTVLHSCFHGFRGDTLENIIPILR